MGLTGYAPLHDTTVTTTLADSYPSCLPVCLPAWPLQYAKEIKHTHSSSWTPEQILKSEKFFLILIYATNFDNLLPKESIYPTYVHTLPFPSLGGGQWVLQVLVLLLVLVMLLMDFPFYFPFLNCIDWELCHNLRKPLECLSVPATFCAPIRWWPQVGSVFRNVLDFFFGGNISDSCRDFLLVEDGRRFAWFLGSFIEIIYLFYNLKGFLLRNISKQVG